MWVVFTVAGIFISILGNILVPTIKDRLTRTPSTRRRKPRPVSKKVWIAFVACTVVMISTGILATFAPASPLALSQVPQIVVTQEIIVIVVALDYLPPEEGLVTPTPTPFGPSWRWVEVMTEDFEGIFPTAGWTTRGRRYFWGPNDYIPHGGFQSAWPATYGDDGGLDPESNNYPNNAQSWLIYGPFDLSDAPMAEMAFSYWNKSEEGHDYLKWAASIDGANFFAWQTSGDSEGWQNVVFDLAQVPGLGKATEQLEVWVALVFESDDAIMDKGPFIDDIVLRKLVKVSLQETP